MTRAATNLGTVTREQRKPVRKRPRLNVSADHVVVAVGGLIVIAAVAVVFVVACPR